MLWTINILLFLWASQNQLVVMVNTFVANVSAHAALSVYTKASAIATCFGPSAVAPFSPSAAGNPTRMRRRKWCITQSFTRDPCRLMNQDTDELRRDSELGYMYAFFHAFQFQLYLKSFSLFWVVLLRKITKGFSSWVHV